MILVTMATSMETMVLLVTLLIMVTLVVVITIYDIDVYSYDT